MQASKRWLLSIKFETTAPSLIDVIVWALSWQIRLLVFTLSLISSVKYWKGKNKNSILHNLFLNLRDLINSTKMSKSKIYYKYIKLLSFDLLVKQAIGIWCMRGETNTIVSHRNMASYILHSYTDRMVWWTYYNCRN